MSTPNTSNTGSDFLGTFITLRPKTDKPHKWPDIHVLSYYSDYVLIKECPPPHNPAKKLIGHEFEEAFFSFLDYFKKNISKKETIRIERKTANKYNISNGLIAIYTDDRIEVAKIPYIWEENLKSIGYTRDESLPIPFANGEAYYDIFRDELLAIW